MQSAIGKYLAKTELNLHEYKPVFYRLTDSKDETNFLDLLNLNKELQVYDQITGQLEELVRSLNPETVFTKEELASAANEHTGTTPKEKYGVWVYYKWS